jgi:aspartate kinase
MQPVVVQKYGGSSLGGRAELDGVADAVAARHRADGPLVVVVSARGKATDELLALAEGTGGTRTERETDQLLATGECASAALIAMALRRRGVPAASLNAWQAGIRASGKHGEGVLTSIDTGRIRHLLGAGTTAVVAGFQGVDEHGDLLTLGRGGSDTTAVALAAELGAARCEIYTDVDGISTADPRVVPEAQVLPAIDVSVMTEMAFAGARVMHSRAVELAATQGIDLYVRRSPSPHGGTVIRRHEDPDALETRGVVVGVTHDAETSRVLIHAMGGRRDLAADVLGILADNSMSVDLVARSGPHEQEFRMGFTVRREDLREVRPALERHVAELGGRVHVDTHVGKLSLIGMGLLNRPEYTARLLSTLSGAGIWTSWISTSQLRTSVVVPLDRLYEAVALLHGEFGLEHPGATQPA